MKAIAQGLEDVKAGRVTEHSIVMKQARERLEKRKNGSILD
jgi:predicted transcriptional regulator